MATIVGTVAAVALLLFAWFSVFSIIPRCRTSLFRYKLWSLRDQIADEIRAGHFEDDDKARSLRTEVERTIRWAPEMTPLKLSLVRWACRDLERLPANTRAELFQGLGPQDATLFTERIEVLDNLTLKHVFLDSPSGWIHLLRAFTRAVCSELASHRRSSDHSTVLKDAKLRVSAEVEPDLYIGGAEEIGKHRSQEPLSLQV